MAFENQMNENEVSGPLKHLLSIDWENAVKPSSENDEEANKNQLKNLKQCKKVRFADELEHLKIIDYDEREDNLSSPTECNEYKISLKNDMFLENDSMISENSIHCKNEDKKVSSPTETLFYQDEESDGQIITEIHDQLDDFIPVSSLCENVSCSIDSLKQEHLTEATEIAFHIQDMEIQSESIATCKNRNLNYSDTNDTDAEVENGKVSDQNEPTQLWKMELKMSMVEKQSSKINSLLEKSNFTCHRAADFQRAIFQAWCEVKHEQKVRRKEKNPPTIHRNNEKEEQTAITNAYLRWKKSKRVQKNMKDKNNIDSCTMNPANEDDKNESEAVFKMWKKKKDAMLLKRKAEGNRLEQEENLNLMMKEELRKEEAELAYAAWKYHKYEVGKKEKHKQDWILLKEKEKILLQNKRNDEALTVYLKWLERKKYSETSINQEEIICKDTKQKAPWYPPNKI